MYAETVMAIPGACVNGLNYHPDRGKVSGRMWGGSASVSIGKDVTVHLMLWAHLSDNETLSSLLPHFSVKVLDYRLGPVNTDVSFMTPTEAYHARKAKEN